MKIKCKRIISATTKEDLGDDSPWLTRGSEYVVLAVELSMSSGISMLIQTDHHNEPVFVALNGFEIMEQKIPSNWVTRSEDDCSCWMMPEAWMYETFFEELEDQTEKAMKLFKDEAEVIYREEGMI